MSGKYFEFFDVFSQALITGGLFLQPSKEAGERILLSRCLDNDVAASEIAADLIPLLADRVVGQTPSGSILTLGTRV